MCSATLLLHIQLLSFNAVHFSLYPPLHASCASVKQVGALISVQNTLLSTGKEKNQIKGHSLLKFCQTNLMTLNLYFYFYYKQSNITQNHYLLCSLYIYDVY